MAPVKSRYTRLLVGTDGAGGAWDFSGVSNSLAVDVPTEMLEDTVFQSARTFLAGTPSGSIKQNGYYDDAIAGTFEQEIAEAIDNAELLYVAGLFGTDTAACAAYVAPQTNTDNMAISTPIAGLIALNGSWGNGTGLQRGLRLYTGTISATGAQTHIDLGAAGSTGGAAWLYVTTITGSATSATCTVQSAAAADFASAATEATFTFSATGCFAVSMSGAIGRYVRLNCTSKGGATSFAVTAIVAVNGITQ